MPEPFIPAEEEFEIGMRAARDQAFAPHRSPGGHTVHGSYPVTSAIEISLSVAGFSRHQANGDGRIQGKPQGHASPDKCHRHDAALREIRKTRCAVIWLNP